MRKEVLLSYRKGQYRKKIIFFSLIVNKYRLTINGKDVLSPVEGPAGSKTSVRPGEARTS